MILVWLQVWMINQMWYFQEILHGFYLKVIGFPKMASDELIILIMFQRLLERF